MGRKVTIRTLRTSSECPDNYTCPSIHAVTEEPDRRYVITKRVTDPDTLTAFAHLIADDEQLGYVPADLIPEV